MDKVIYKYELHPGLCSVMLPDGYKILSVGFQGDVLMLWALVPEYVNHSIVILHVVLTGQNVDGSSLGKHIGTTESAGGFVAHVFAPMETPNG